MTSIDLGAVVGLSDDDNEELLVSPVRDAEKGKMRTLTASDIAPSFVPADLAAMLDDAEAKLEETKFSVLSEQTVSQSHSINDTDDDDLEDLEELRGRDDREEAKFSGEIKHSTSTIVRTVSQVEEEMRELQLSGATGEPMPTITTTRKVKFDPSGSDVVVASGSPLISPLAAMPFDLKFSPFPKTPGRPFSAARSVSSDVDATAAPGHGGISDDLVSPSSDLIDGSLSSNPAVHYATTEEAREEAMMGTTPERAEEAPGEEKMTLTDEKEHVQRTVVTVVTEVDESAFVPTPSSGTSELDESAFIPTSSVNDEDDMDDEMFFPNRESCMTRTHKPQPPSQQQPQTETKSNPSTSRRNSVSTEQKPVKAPLSTKTMRPSEQTLSKPASASKPRVSMPGGKTPSWRTRANIAFNMNAKKPLGQREAAVKASTPSANVADTLPTATTTTRAKYDKENLTDGSTQSVEEKAIQSVENGTMGSVGTGRAPSTMTHDDTSRGATTTNRQPATGVTSARTHQRTEMVGRKPVTVPKGPKLATESVRDRRSAPGTTSAITRSVPAAVSRNGGQQKPAATVARAPRLSTASRATRSRQSVGGVTEGMKTEATPPRPLTAPISPRLATSTVASRRDPSQGKGQKEVEKFSQFKARPIGKGVMTTAGGGGDHGVPKVAKKALTVPAPFRLMTEARNGIHSDDHDMTDAQGATLPSKPFQARPVPDFSKTPTVVSRATASHRTSTTPAPFKLRSGERSRVEAKEQLKPRKDLTIPKPFKLSGSRDNERMSTKEEAATKERNQQFHARPMPDFSRPPRQSVGTGTKTRRPITTPAPFKFHAAEQRSKEATTAGDNTGHATDSAAQFKARPMPNFSRPPAAVPQKVPNSKRQLTTPEPFKLHTSQRPQETRSVSTDGEPDHHFHARPMPDFSRPPSTSKQQTTPVSRKQLTTPEPFRLHTDSRSQDKPRPLSTEERMAAECRQFQARPAPQFSKPPVAPQQRTSTQRQVTTPEPFRLSTDVRSQEKPRPLSSEEMFVAECKQFQAKPAPNFSRPPVAPKARSTPQRVLTTPEPFRLSTDARSQERPRPVSTEEMLASECRQFQAKPAPNFSRPPAQRTHTPQRVVTTPEPFALSTGARSEERPRPLSSEELLAAECQQFRAKPAPKFPQPVFSQERSAVARRPLTTPEPFRFHTGDRATDSKKIVSSEELEAMECKKQFRAKPPPTFAVGLPLDKKPVSRRPLTTPEPFTLHTSERMHEETKRLSTEEITALEYQKQFHARPAPMFPTAVASDPPKVRSQRRLTTPEPFNFHSGNRRKTIQSGPTDHEARHSEGVLFSAGQATQDTGGSNRKKPTQPMPFTLRTAERRSRETSGEEDTNAERRCLFPTSSQDNPSAASPSPSRPSKRQAEETVFDGDHACEKRNKQNTDVDMSGGPYQESADLVDIPGQNFFVAERIRAGREEAQGVFNPDGEDAEDSCFSNHDVAARNPDEGTPASDTFYFGTAEQDIGEGTVQSDLNVVHFLSDSAEGFEQQESTTEVDFLVPDTSVGMAANTEICNEGGAVAVGESAALSATEPMQEGTAPVVSKRTTSTGRQNKGLGNAALRRMRLQMAFEAKERARAAAAKEERRRSSDSFGEIET